MGIFGQNCEFVAKNPLFSLISCEKKLKILYSVRKKVGKWAERVTVGTIRGREINMCYNERRCLFMSRSKIFQYIYVIAFLGILAFLPYAIIYAAVKIFNFLRR